MKKTKPKNRRGASAPAQQPELPRYIVADADDPIDWIEAAAGDEAAPTVPKFKGIAYSGGLARPRGCWYPVVFDLAGLRVPAKGRPVHRNHDTNKLVGHTETVENDGRRIACHGLCSAVNEHQEEVVKTGRNGFPWRLSLGVAPDDDGGMVYVDKGEKVAVNGRNFTGPLMVCRKGTLHEISFVSLAGDDNTSATITAAANLQEDAMPPFAQWIAAQGFDPATLTDQQRTQLQATYDRLVKLSGGSDAGADGDDSADADAGSGAQLQASGNDAALQLQQQLRQTATTEVTRIAGVRRICAEHGGPSLTVNGQEATIEAMALEQGWDLTRTELECLRESRSRGPAVHSHGRDQDCTLEAMQGALMLRNGLALDNPAWRSPQAIALEIPAFLRRGLNDDTRQRYMEAAHRYSDMSLLDVCREAIRLQGRNVPSGRQAIIEASFSTMSLSNIFTANVNAQLLATYMEAPDSTRGWTRETDVADYKLNERVRLVKGASLEPLPAGGTADHDDRTDQKEEYRIARYAKQFVVDEIDIINDAFNALSDMPIEMAKAAQRLRPDLVYAILLANAALGVDGVALFHADHANTAAGAALAEATLKAAITALAIQQENGVNLNLPPTHLIVPQTLSFTGDALLQSAETRAVAATGGPTMNTLQGKVRTRVSDSRLDNGVTDPATGTTHSGSTSTWYLASTEAHTIEVGYLRGTGRAPRVRRFNLTEGKFGIGWDVSHSIGAKALDFRGLQRRQA